MPVTERRRQLEGKSHWPWMKTTGVAVVAFARSTWASSRSVIVVGEAIRAHHVLLRDPAIGGLSEASYGSQVPRRVAAASPGCGERAPV